MDEVEVSYGPKYWHGLQRKLDSLAVAAPVENKMESGKCWLHFLLLKKARPVLLTNGCLLDDSNRRSEGLLLQGVPIGNLSTEKIFEYCAYYSSTTVAQLEWGQYAHACVHCSILIFFSHTQLVDDKTCVLVYEDSTMATTAYNALRKSAAEVTTSDELEMVPCHPIRMQKSTRAYFCIPFLDVMLLD